MGKELLNDRYKLIPLYSIGQEEYEMNEDNIAEVSVLLNNIDISKECEVHFNLSKEALIGFAHHAMRLAYEYQEGIHVHIDPLGVSYSNQAMGFFLTPESPDLILYCKNNGCLNDYSLEKNLMRRNGSCYPITLKFNYLIDMLYDSDYCETYNIGFDNVAEIRVVKDETDITKRCVVLYKFSKNALIGLATEFIRLAHNYCEGKSDIIYPLWSETPNCKLGFFLTAGSATMIIGCKELGNVYEYDRCFGKDW
jgi:hypothetical protein